MTPPAPLFTYRPYYRGTQVLLHLYLHTDLIIGGVIGEPRFPYSKKMNIITPFWYYYMNRLLTRIIDKMYNIGLGVQNNIFVTKTNLKFRIEDELENMFNSLSIGGDIVTKTKEEEEEEQDEWTHIFKCCGYNGHDEFIVTSKMIKDAGKTWKGRKQSQFEPRLLCKQDTYEKRPDIFKKHNLCILSVKNGEYLLTKTNIYHILDYNREGHDKIHNLKRNPNSLVLQIGSSETSLIDNLRYSKMFETSDYLDEPIQFGPLLNGRHRCTFTTKLGDKEIKIEGSQYETDSCYESENYILLIEGKGGNNDSFNIRQLYYPYRSIYDTVLNKKKIMPLYINNDKNNIIHIWSFTFVNPLELTSIKCLSYKKYKFVD